MEKRVGEVRGVLRWLFTAMLSSARPNLLSRLPRLALHVLFATQGCLLALAPATVHAQAYPSKAIRFVVPYPPGGPLDTVARLLGAKVGESLG